LFFALNKQKAHKAMKIKSEIKDKGEKNKGNQFLL